MARPHIPSLTGIRGLAAAWVFGFHLLRDFAALFGDGWINKVYDGVFRSGAMGVELFFVLSGFVLTINYADKLKRGLSIGDYGDFIRKRVARIYPNHLFMIVVLAFFAGGITEGPDSAYSLPGLMKSLFLVHGWAPIEQLSWNVPSWSVSSEWLAYLVFPILAVVLLPRLRARYQVGSGLVFLYVLIVFLMFHFSDGAVANEAKSYPLIRILNFVPGVLLGTAYLKGWGDELPWTPIGIAALCGIFFAGLFSADTIITALLPAVIYAAAKGAGPLRNWLATPTMVYLGKTSYAFYMVQMLVLVVWQRSLATAQGWSLPMRIVFFLSVWLINYAAAHLVWSKIEEPGRRFVLSLGSSRKHELARN